MSDPNQEPPTVNPEDAEGVVLLEDDGRKHTFDDPASVKKLIRRFFIVCGFLFFIDFFFLPLEGLPHKHLSFKDGVFPWEEMPGFYCFYGLIACVLLVLAAKQLRKLIMRDEDYYDR